MQHSNVVRRGYCFSNVNEQSKARFIRDFGKASLLLCPFCEIGPGVLAFKKERRRLKIPLQDANKLRSFPQ